MIFPTIGAEVGKYAGQTYKLVNSLPWGASEYSVFSGASPAVANGDMGVVTSTSPGSFAVSLTSTGCPIIDTVFSEARQSFYLDVYDESLAQWYGQTIEWVNNALPVFDGTIGNVEVRSGSPITPVNLGDAVTDGDLDTLAYTVVSGSLPPGLTLDPSTGIITGTP